MVLPHTVIIVECDEDQHKRYDPEDDDERTCTLFTDVQELYNRPLVFIRFNPDGYIDSEGNRHRTPWETGDSEKPLVIGERFSEEWNNRLTLLQGVLKYFMNPSHPPVLDLIVKKLFFDNHDKNSFTYADDGM